MAGVLTALCLSTKSIVQGERLTERLIERLSPLSTFFIMPAFALANTAVPLGGIFGGGAGSVAATVAPALGIGAGLLLGKPLGIFGATWLAIKLGIAQMPSGARRTPTAAPSARRTHKRPSTHEFRVFFWFDSTYVIGTLAR